MQKIKADLLKKNIIDACLKANYILPKSVYSKIKNTHQLEQGRSKRLVGLILENCKIANKEKLPLCQDTGILEVFAYIGQETFIDFQNSSYNTLTDLINSCIETAYKQAYFRKSVVLPLTRKNNDKNIPGVTHIEFVKGSNIDLYIVPKGFGCENMSVLKMFNPTASTEEIIDFIIKQAAIAGPNPCPPIFLGIGIGGTMEKATFLAKEALLGIERKTSLQEKKIINKMKKEIINKTNKLNIGTLGLGGKKTLLDIHINTYPTHIAGLPVAIAFSCWCNRYVKIKL